MMGMFVQVFWFGVKLVMGLKASTWDITAVLWVYLIAMTNS
jgi:hypothetical protein